MIELICFNHLRNNNYVDSVGCSNVPVAYKVSSKEEKKEIIMMTY